jgi:hypothetical protein
MNVAENVFLKLEMKSEEILSHMKWRNALVDDLPGHGEQVLVCVSGVYHLTRYDARKNVFRLIDDGKKYFRTADKDDQPVYWIPIEGTDMTIKYSMA